MAFSSFNLPAKVPICESTALGRLYCHAITTHEHALIDQHPEHAHGPGFVQAAFVATDGHTMGRIFEERTTFFALVMQAVSSYFGFLVVAHGLIVYCGRNKSYVCFVFDHDADLWATTSLSS